MTVHTLPLAGTSRARLRALLAALPALCKLRVNSLIVFTALIGMWLAPPPAGGSRALTMLAATLMLTAVWWHASHHHRLTDAQLDAQEQRGQRIVLLLTAGLFTLSIGLAFLDENVARVSWLLIVPISRRWHK